MKSKWIQKKEKDSLIVFFNGWSMDENPFLGLHSNDYDVVTFYDYTDLNVDQQMLSEINEYPQITIVAWSFGVWTAAKLYDLFDNVKNAVAINGTLKPIDEKFGIPPKIFDFTLKTLSVESKEAFDKNMFANEQSHESFKNNGPKRSFEEQKIELEFFQKHFSVSKEFANLFNKVIIGKKDKIISFKNQLRCWKSQSINPIIIDAPHYIFDKFKNWEELINYEC